MTSPVFPVPLIPLQPGRARSSRAGHTVPQPRRPLGWPDDPDDAGTPLTVSVEHRGEVCVVHADGEVDIATASMLGSALDTGLASGSAMVVVDLQRVSFVDCTGIGLLAQARCRARDQGTRLRIVAGRVVARTVALLELTSALGLQEPA